MCAPLCTESRVAKCHVRDKYWQDGVNTLADMIFLKQGFLPTFVLQNYSFLQVVFNLNARIVMLLAILHWGKIGLKVLLGENKLVFFNSGRAWLKLHWSSQNTAAQKQLRI